jgi:UDP-N-acetylmuramyl tripeptide synthase
MSDDASARLGLPYLAAGQLQKHVTLNEALTRLDALTQMAVVSRTTTAQPAAPPDDIGGLVAKMADAAVLLNISADHLDRHGGMDGYVAAKRRAC